MSLLGKALKFTFSVLAAPFRIASELVKKSAEYTRKVTDFLIDFFLPDKSAEEFRGKLKKLIGTASDFTKDNYEYFVDDNLKKLSHHAPKKIFSKINEAIEHYEESSLPELTLIAPENSPRVVSAERLDRSHSSSHTISSS